MLSRAALLASNMQLQSIEAGRIDTVLTNSDPTSFYHQDSRTPSSVVVLPQDSHLDPRHSSDFSNRPHQPSHQHPSIPSQSHYSMGDMDNGNGDNVAPTEVDKMSKGKRKAGSTKHSSSPSKRDKKGESNNAASKRASKANAQPVPFVDRETIEMREEALKALLARLPQADVMELQEALYEADWDVDAAVLKMESYHPESKSQEWTSQESC